MRHIELKLNTLKRPKLMLEAARNGLASYIGMTKGTMSGRLAAEALNGIDSQLLKDIQAMGNPEQLPPQPILSMGIWAKVKWWEWMQRSEM